MLTKNCKSFAKSRIFCQILRNKRRNLAKFREIAYTHDTKVGRKYNSSTPQETWVNIVAFCVTMNYRMSEPEESLIGIYTIVQPDQINMVVLSSYLVNSDASIRYGTAQ